MLRAMLLRSPMTKTKQTTTATAAKRRLVEEMSMMVKTFTLNCALNSYMRVNWCVVSARLFPLNEWLPRPS